MIKIIFTNLRHAFSAIAIVIAVVGTGVAQAQSSVTLYGTIDAGLQYANKVPSSSQSNVGNTFAFSTSGLVPSNFGLTGHEDLGGGLRTNFDLESGISVANGGYGSSNGNFWGRRAWVGISGGFGEVRMGLQFSPFYEVLLGSDPRSFSGFGSGLVIYADNVGFTGSLNSNAISYKSPNLAGFQGTVMFAPGGIAGNFQAGQQWSVAEKYDSGFVTLDVAMYHGNAGGTPTPVLTTAVFDGRTIGVVMRFGSLSVKSTVTNFHLAGSFDEYVYAFGGDDYITPALNLNAGVYYSGDAHNSANHSFMPAIGVTYSLSKRTLIYVQAAMVRNYGTMANGLTVGDLAVYREVPNTASIGATIGIKHSF